MKLVAAIETKLQEGMTDLHLLMASPGGFVDPEMAIYNFLRGIAVKVVTYNYGCERSRSWAFGPRSSLESGGRRGRPLTGNSQ
jgi:ATP-dependent protease ClpP protease subunit